MLNSQVPSKSELKREHLEKTGRVPAPIAAVCVAISLAVLPPVASKLLGAVFSTACSGGRAVGRKSRHTLIRLLGGEPRENVRSAPSDRLSSLRHEFSPADVASPPRLPPSRTASGSINVDSPRYIAAKQVLEQELESALAAVAALQSATQLEAARVNKLQSRLSVGNSRR